MKNKTLLLLMVSLCLLVTMTSVSASDVSDINQNISDSNSFGVGSDLNEISSLDSSLSSSDDESIFGIAVSDDDSSEDSVDKVKSSLSSSSNNSSSSSISSNTTKGSATIAVSSKTVVRGDYFNITLKDKNTNKALSGKAVTFTLNNKTYSRTTDSNGLAKLSITGIPKVYLITVSFSGDSDYGGTSQTISITLTKTPTTIVNSGAYLDKGKTYKLTLKDAYGNLLTNKKIVLGFNGKTYNKTTNSKGQVGLTINQAVGKTYTLTYKFAGNANFLAASGSKNIKIRLGTVITGSGSSIVKGNTYKITLKDANGAALANQKVVFTFGSKTYNRTTDSKGSAGLKVSANSNKSYSLTYFYAGTSYYGSSLGSVSLFVKTPTTISNSGSSLVSGTPYKIILKDSGNKVLSNKNVTFTINGKTYARTTDANGQASLTINYAAGKSYPFSYKFAGDKEYGPSSGSLSLRIKKATTLSGSGNALIQGNSYAVTLKDSSGTLLANQTVTFTFGTKTYNRTTNSKGVASLKVTAAAGKSYALSCKYAGTSYYNASSLSQFNLKVKYPTTIANSGSSIMNGSSYKLTLKDSNNKTLANKTIVTTFNGKTYTGTTNSNGQVSIKIESTSPKAYTLSYKFAGDSDYGAYSGSVSLNVKFNNLFTIAQIKAASATLKSYVVKNGKVPATVSVNGISLNYTSFTYLMSKAIIAINSNKTSDISLVSISSNYSNNGSSSIKGNLMKANYIDLANKLNAYAESNKAIPNNINTSLGLISPNLYGFGLAKALVFHDEEGYLPNYLIMDSSDLDGKGSSDTHGNASQFKKGLNEKETLNASQIASYATASGHDALNSAIKALAAQLVAGKSTLWAKATAIFNYVRDNISYSYYANSVKSASGTLSSKSGNCCDQANLIVALCRAANMTARFSHAQGCTFSSGLVTGHVWAQIYVDGVWYSADATSTRNSLGNIHNWNTNSFNTLKQYVHLSF